MLETLLNLAPGRLFKGDDERPWNILGGVIHRDGPSYQLAWRDGGQIWWGLCV